jgi:hypothetical protein
LVKRIYFSLLLIFSFNSIYSTENIDIKINSNKTNVVPNEIFEISVEITGAPNVDFKGIENPDTSVKLQQSGVMSNFSFINGVGTSSQTLNFLAKITKEGSFNIGPFLFNINNKIYKSETIKIDVSVNNNEVKSNTENENQGEPDTADNYSTGGNKNLNYLLKLDVDKKEVFVNEYFDVSVKFLAREQLQTLGYEGLKFPPTAWIEKIETKDNYKGKVKVNGLIYEEYELEKKRVYISKEGTVKIPPVVFNLNGFTGNSIAAFPEEMSIHTDPLNVNVKALPPHPPASYSGNVGNFTVNSGISAKTVKIKEPVTLQISISGEGNFQNIKDLGYKVEGSGIDEYSSKSEITNSGNIKTKNWEILLVPNKSGNFKIKLNDFIYFDTTKKDYVKIKGKEYNLSVPKSEKNEKRETESVIVHSDVNNKKEEKPDEINFIKTAIGNKTNIFNYNFYFIVMILLYSIVILCFVIYIVVKYLIFSRLVNQKQIMKRNSYRTFISGISKIRKIIKKGLSEKIIDDLSVVIEKYFITKFDIDSIEFTKNGIQEKLGLFLKNGQNESLKNIFAEIDMMRFGGIDYNAADIEKLINEANLLIKQIENQE